MAVVFADHQGRMRALRLPGSATPLINYVRKHFPGPRVAFAYEAGPAGFGLHDELVQQAYTCVVVAPSKVPRVPGERVKTNRLDGRKLAESLRGGQLHNIHVPTRGFIRRRSSSCAPFMITCGRTATCRLRCCVGSIWG